MTPTSSNDTRALAESLAQRHAAMTAGNTCTHAQAVRDSDAAHPTETAAVVQACRMLGFPEHDADCVARAWAAQSQRLDGFDATCWPTEPQDFGIPPWPRTNAFPPCPQQLGLYAVLPDAQWIARMAQAGVPTLQLRFKSDDAAAIVREVRAAVRAVEGTASLLFINDHWQAAMDAGAYGLHLGQEDLDVAPIERIRQSGLHLGLSTHGYAEMLRADAVAPSYLALGAIFPTTLKKMQTPPQGLGRLHAYARLMRHHSLVAIGGIDTTRIAEVMTSGVGSIAVVRAITGAVDPEAAAREFEESMKAARKAVENVL